MVGFKIIQKRASHAAGAFRCANYRNRFWSEHRVQCRAAMAEEIALPLSSRAAHSGQPNLSSAVYLNKFVTEGVVRQRPSAPLVGTDKVSNNPCQQKSKKLTPPKSRRWPTP